MPVVSSNTPKKSGYPIPAGSTCASTPFRVVVSAAKNKRKAPTCKSVERLCCTAVVNSVQKGGGSASVQGAGVSGVFFLKKICNRMPSAAEEIIVMINKATPAALFWKSMPPTAAITNPLPGLLANNESHCASFFVITFFS